MANLRKYIRMTVGLGVLSLLAIFISYLALADIAHGESDLSLEWKALRVAALLILMFTASTFATMWRVHKAIKSL